MPADDATDVKPRPALYSLKQASTELGISYRRAMQLVASGYFGELTRSGDKGQGPYLIPAGVLERVRDSGQQVAS